MANAINSFVSTMSKAGGFARPSQFEIVITPPSAGQFADLIRDGQNVMARNNIRATMIMLDSLSEVNKQLVLQCDSVSMPAHDLQTQNMQHGGEPGREIVQTHGYAGTIDCSFYLSRDLREKHYFELWQALAVNNSTHKANYYDDYVGSMEIYQLSTKAKQNRSAGPHSNLSKLAKFESERTYGIKATEVYPKTVGSVAYGHGSANEIASLDVRFEFHNWINLGTGTDHESANPKLFPGGFLDEYGKFAFKHRNT
jgi:hypothetical protein